MKKIMSIKVILSISLLFFVSLVMASADEAQYQKEIIGSWQERDVLETGVVLQKTFTFSPDGKFEVAAKRIEDEKTSSYKSEGTWVIQDQILHYTILHSTHPKIPSGYQYTNKIIKINEKEILTESPEGKQTTAYRIKK